LKRVAQLVFQALSILTTYLTSSPISPLQQHFVELGEPIATDVDANILLNSEAAITIDFENVPIEKMELIDQGSILPNSISTVNFSDKFSSIWDQFPPKISRNKLFSLRDMHNT
jgi:hypothetical protein